MLFLKTLLSFFTKSDKKFSIFLLMLMLLTAFIELVGIGSLFPYIKILGNKSYIHHSPFLSKTYQYFNFNNDNGFLIFIGSAIFFMLVLKAIMSTYNNFFQAKLTYRINNRLSKYCLNSFLNMPYIKAIEKNSSILSKHLLLDVSSVATMIQAILTVMTDMIVAFALVALMISVYPSLVFSVVTSLGVVVLLINRFLKRRINVLSIANEKCNRFAYKTSQEALLGLKDVKIYNVQKYFVERYLKWQYKIAKQMIEFSVVSNLPTNILNVIGFGVLLIALLYLIISHGNLVTVLPTIGLIAVSIQRLLPTASRITTSIANIRRYRPLVFVVRESIDAISLKDKNPSSDMEVQYCKNLHFTHTLELRNISYSYPNTKSKALDDVSFVIKKNSIFGIVGESGAGKSTLVDVLLGLLSIDSGCVLSDGNEIPNRNGGILSHFVGYVPQQVFLLDATIRENIAFGIDPDDIDEDALHKAIEIAQLNDLIAQLPEGINTQIGEKGAKLSGGQRQRIGIARALYRDPQILIMDEATNALDSATEKEFNMALKGLMKEKTLIIIAHRLSSVQICDEIVQLEKGRVVASGCYEDLLKNPEFRRIYNLNEESSYA